MSTALVWLIAIPLVGAAVGALLPARFAKSWAMLVSLLTFAVGVCLALQYRHGGTPAFIPRGRDSALVLEALGVSFRLSMDAISMWLVLLTVILTPCAILFSFASIKEREKEYYAWMLLLLAAMLGVFVEIGRA